MYFDAQSTDLQYVAHNAHFPRAHVILTWYLFHLGLATTASYPTVIGRMMHNGSSQLLRGRRSRLFEATKGPQWHPWLATFVMRSQIHVSLLQPMKWSVYDNGVLHATMRLLSTATSDMHAFRSMERLAGRHQGPDLRFFLAPAFSAS